jgi:hypothetical protein
MDPSSLKASSFNDPAHFPFYYHIGSMVPAKSVVEIGVGLGLRGACLVRGGETQRYLGLQIPRDNQFYSMRLAKGNIRDHAKKNAIINIHHGIISDQKFIDILNGVKWDVAVISEEASVETMISYLDALWGNMKLGGLLLVDYLDRCESNRLAYDEFCKIKHRDAVIAKTRYGVGLLQK